VFRLDAHRICRGGHEATWSDNRSRSSKDTGSAWRVQGGPRSVKKTKTQEDRSGCRLSSRECVGKCKSFCTLNERLIETAPPPSLACRRGRSADSIPLRLPDDIRWESRRMKGNWVCGAVASYRLSVWSASCVDVPNLNLAGPGPGMLQSSTLLAFSFGILLECWQSNALS
jgi:hypothetical protein